MYHSSRTTTVGPAGQAYQAAPTLGHRHSTGSMHSPPSHAHAHHGGGASPTQHYRQPMQQMPGSSTSNSSLPRLVEQDYLIDTKPFSRRNGMFMFHARHRETGEIRALKVYDARHMDPEKEARVREEARIGLMIPPHVGIVNSIDFYPGEDKMSIVMDLWEGGSLLEELLHSGYMSEIRAGRILHQLLSALAHIHANRVMHRDIKPENIFLSLQSVRRDPQSGGAGSAALSSHMPSKYPAGQEDRVAIGDFSLATTRIPSSDYVGSPQYSAPELAMIALHAQIRNLGRPLYNEKCDIWSVGICAFVMLTGLLPFDGETSEAVFMEVIKNTIPFEKAPHLSAGAKDFILSLTKSNPSARPSAKDAMRHTWLVTTRGG